MLSRHRHNALYLSFGGAISLLLLGRACYVKASVHQTLSAAYGTTSQDQILKRTFPLCDLFVPQETPLKLQAVPLSVYDRFAHRHHYWSVDCVDARDVHLLHFLWNADTNTLQEVSHSFPRSESQPPSLSSRQAVAKAKHWLTALEPNSSTLWQARFPLTKNENWIVHFHSHHQQARVILDAHTGDLNSFAKW